MLYELTFDIAESDRYETKVVEGPAHRKGLVPAAIVDFASDFAWANFGPFEMVRIAIHEYRPLRVGFSDGNTVSSRSTVLDNYTWCTGWRATVPTS